MSTKNSRNKPSKKRMDADTFDINKNVEDQKNSKRSEFISQLRPSNKKKDSKDSNVETSSFESFKDEIVEF